MRMMMRWRYFKVSRKLSARLAILVMLLSIKKFLKEVLSV